MMSGSNGGGGPCGACKFLRRKCVKGCVFAPYFDADQGTAHFAAVHKVFGASNASKLLTRIPPHKRLDAVVTLCFEAIARARDPVYGCVSHIVALQQQVVNLQAELAYTHTHLSTLQQRLPMASASQAQSAASPPSLHSMNMASGYNVSILQFDPLQTHQQTSYFNPFDQEIDGGDLQALAREFVAKYLPGVKRSPWDSD